MRPSSASPTGISSRRPVRLTVSPSTILLPVAEQHGADVVGLEVQREAGHVVRQLEHLERHAVLEAVDAGDAVARPTARCRPRSGRRSPTSSPSMRLLRMLVISSGLICMCVVRSLTAQALRDLLAKLFEAVADGRVEDRVADAQHDARRGSSGRRCASSSTVRPVCSPISLADALDDGSVELDGARDLDRQELVLVVARAASNCAPDAEDHRHAVVLDQQRRGSSRSPGRRPRRVCRSPSSFSSVEK